MQNNIQIRNLYIRKVQNKIDKLINSVRLLNNLNNTINNQYGGTNPKKIDDGLALVQNAKNYLDASKAPTEQFNKLTLKAATYGDTELATLNANVKLLKDTIIKLRTQLTNQSSDSATVADLRNQLAEVSAHLTVANKKLEEATKQNDADKLKFDTALNEFTDTLILYRAEIDRLRDQMPKQLNDSIIQLNNQIDEEIKILNFIKQLKNTQLIPKIQKKYSQIFENVAISDLITALNNFRITNKTEEIKTNEIFNNLDLAHPINIPYTTEGYNLNNKINEAITPLYTKYYNYKDKNKSFNDAMEFFKNYKKFEDSLQAELIAQRLGDASIHTEYHQYFDIENFSDLTKN